MDSGTATMATYDATIDPLLRGIAPSSLHSPITQPLHFNSPQLYQQNSPGSDNQNGNDPKRSRACEACRGLKVRCDPDPNNPDGPCKRCAKANRNCVVTAPNRKRQKKTDSRVAELEKKIDALTANLAAAQRAGGSTFTATHDGVAFEPRPNLAHSKQHPYQQIRHGGYGSPYMTCPEVCSHGLSSQSKPDYEQERAAPAPTLAPSLASPILGAGQKRKNIENHATPAVPSKRTQPMASWLEPAPKRLGASEYTDISDIGPVTDDMASKMFDCYVEKMAPHMPFVVFAPGTTYEEVRKSKPILFLAILSVSSSLNYPQLQRPLTIEMMSVFADRIICQGEKTLELVQALHISAIWYWPPEHYEELKFYQLIHISASMAIEIGIHRKNKPSKSSLSNITGLFRDNVWRHTPHPDPESLDARRAWLACYWLCCNASMGLRRPNLVRWSPFMAESVSILENSPQAFESDKVLCQWVKSQHIAEEIGMSFSMDDPIAVVSISDAKVQYAMKGFENDLAKWSAELKPELMTLSSKMTEHFMNLYMHEVAMHVDHNVDEFKSPFNEETLQGLAEDVNHPPLIAVHVSALSICLTAIDRIFETFLDFDIETIRCLPISSLVRVAYAVVVLIKMYFASATPKSELGKVIDKNHMKVEYYLDVLVETFKAAAAGEKSRPSARFMTVLVMLKTWFHRQQERKQQPGKPDVKATPTPSIGGFGEHVIGLKQTDSTSSNSQQSHFEPPNTPLQLLSEVATGNSGGQTKVGNHNNYSHTASEWQQSQHHQTNYSVYSAGPYAGNPGIAQVTTGASLDPALGYTGGGYEQAMSLALGVGDFGPYFDDDALFGGLINSTGPQVASFDGL